MIAVFLIDGSVLILVPLWERHHFIELFINNMWSLCLFSFTLEWSPSPILVRNRFFHTYLNSRPAQFNVAQQSHVDLGREKWEDMYQSRIDIHGSLCVMEKYALNAFAMFFFFLIWKFVKVAFLKTVLSLCSLVFPSCSCSSYWEACPTSTRGTFFTVTWNRKTCSSATLESSN